MGLMVSDDRKRPKNQESEKTEAWFPSKFDKRLILFGYVIASIALVSFGLGLIVAFLIWVLVN